MEEQSSARNLINKRLIAINISSSILVKILNITILVWLNSYLLKRISPGEYSLYPVVASVMAFGPILSSLMTGGLGRFSLNAYAKNDDRGVTQIVSTMFPILLGVGSAVAVIGGIFAWNINHFLNIDENRVSDAQIMMGLMILLLAIRLPLAPFGTGLFIRQKFVLENLVSVACEFFRIALLMTLILGVGPRILWIVVAMTASDFLRLMIRQYQSRKLVTALRFDRSLIHWGQSKELMSFGSWNFVSKVADTIRTSADPLILNKMAGAFEVSCFYLGSTVTSQMQQACWLILEPLQPALITMDALQDEKRLRSVFLRSGRYALWAVMLIAAPLIVFHSEVIILYVGSEYVKAGTIMMMLLILLPLTYVSILVPNLALAKAKVKGMAISHFITQIANLFLTLFLVGGLKWGAVGSATATLVTCTLGGFFWYWPLGLSLVEVSFNRWLKETILPGLAPSIGVIIILELARVVHPPNGWIMLGVYTLCGGIVNLGLIHKVMQAGDRELVDLIIRKFRNLGSAKCQEV